MERNVNAARQAGQNAIWMYGKKSTCAPRANYLFIMAYYLFRGMATVCNPNVVWCRNVATKLWIITNIEQEKGA